MKKSKIGLPIWKSFQICSIHLFHLGSWLNSKLEALLGRDWQCALMEGKFCIAFNIVTWFTIQTSVEQFSLWKFHFCFSKFKVKQNIICKVKWSYKRKYLRSRSCFRASKCLSLWSPSILHKLLKVIFSQFLNFIEIMLHIQQLLIENGF